MSWGAFLITLAFGVLLPTLDVFTDIYSGIKLAFFNPCLAWSRAGNGIENHPKYGAAMLTPPFISWLFVVRQWYKTEVGTARKLKTLPLLLLQLYPQWRALKVLYHAKWKRSNDWPRMKHQWETEISNLGESFTCGIKQPKYLCLLFAFRAVP